MTQFSTRQSAHSAAAAPLAAALMGVALCAYLLPASASGAEINYGALKDQRGDTLLLEYKSPAGAQYFSCGIEGSCEAHGDTPPTLFPTLLGSATYPKSADGRLAVRPFTVGTMSYYFLYDLTQKKPKQVARLPYTKPNTTVLFSKNNDAVVFKDGLTYTRYELATKKLSSVILAQNLAFLSISPSATYITGYNYGTERHELWSTKTGRKIDGLSAMQSYLEFSEDEAHIAYLDDVEGFRTLFTVPVEDLGSASPRLVQLTKPNTEVEDYLFAGPTLFYLANVYGPLDWDLFSYDRTKNEIAVVDRDVSYGDFLKRVRSEHGSLLAYQKTDGRNTNLVLYHTNPGEMVTLAPVKDSPLTGKVKREVKTYGDRTGVLLSPVSRSSKRTERNLFIWMHGGPMRQVAKGYHPYLSYAVYDELLERLAEGGSYVYKIDYTGSTGYGADFRKALTMKVGDVEIADVRNAIAEIKKEHPVKHVYLIGNSYGGYMALRGIVDMPKSIRGAVSINGVSDWYGLVQQIPTSPFRDVFGGVPDLHNLDAYLQASVFTGMDALTKDHRVLVVWGEQDSTVPVWQSTKYLDYAKTQQATVESLSFPDEDHILRKRTNLDALCKKVTSFLGVKAGCSVR